jgi:hypothetical protein
MDFGYHALKSLAGRAKFSTRMAFLKEKRGEDKGPYYS